MKRLNQQIDYLSDLGKIIKAYEEIAAYRMQNVRQKVLKNREFTSELNQIFQIVKNSYQEALKKYKLSTSRWKNNKTARVFLSANTGLYGDIVQRIFDLFYVDLKKYNSDAVVVGRLGRSLFESSNINQKYVYFEIPDKLSTLEEIKQIIEYLTPYETVVVYHGLFKNVIMSEAMASNISGDVGQLPEEKVPTRQLIFEPSLPQILYFFENEISSSIFLHVIFESQLAKFSSRMAALEQASENIKKETMRTKMENVLSRKRSIDKEQLEMLAGRSLWEN